MRKNLAITCESIWQEWASAFELSFKKGSMDPAIFKKLRCLDCPALNHKNLRPPAYGMNDELADAYKSIVVFNEPMDYTDPDDTLYENLTEALINRSSTYEQFMAPLRATNSFQNMETIKEVETILKDLQNKIFYPAYYTNAVKCYDEAVKDKKTKIKEALEHCYDYFIRELKVIDSPVVLTFGNASYLLMQKLYEDELRAGNFQFELSPVENPSGWPLSKSKFSSNHTNIIIIEDNLQGQFKKRIWGVFLHSVPYRASANIKGVKTDLLEKVSNRTHKPDPELEGVEFYRDSVRTTLLEIKELIPKVQL